MLARLGWTQKLRQQNLSAKGHEHVPDGLLFADAQARARANAMADEWRRYGEGAAIVESKRWGCPLDSRAGAQTSAPSTQMLRYLRRVDDLTGGRLRWGVLTDGGIWRLYWQGALSVSEQFFEIDLPAILDIPGHNDGLFALDARERRHWLKVFALVFRREAFLPDAEGGSFHRRAIERGRFDREAVTKELLERVFDKVFPGLVRALAADRPQAPLAEARDAALVLLYRLLFVLYAEDRDLLPVNDARYDDYGLRERVRRDVGRRKDAGDAFSTSAAQYWSILADLTRAIDRGDASIGLPPYNGGLFAEDAAPLLAQARIADATMADTIDALSFRTVAGERRYINYRDLGVRQLGSIYERLLEREPVRGADGAVMLRPNVFARKDSGSYYTPDDLVGLILAEAVGPLADARMEAFAREAEEPAGGPMAQEVRLARLAKLDPAERILDLRVCDPAMGSGHFLVNLVDYLSDRAIAAMAEAEALVEGYASPLTRRIDDIRAAILDNAQASGWAVDPAQLDDRRIVRRMVLKRCVYGVDKTPMAVELAKVSLWLHTFTVGAPLSFLDHHLRCGDSLFGAWARRGIERAVEHGSPLLLHEPIARAERSAAGMQTVESLTDAEIAEAQRSAEAFAEVERATRPLNALLSLVHAFDWLDARGKAAQTALQAFFGGQFGDPVAIALGEAQIPEDREEGAHFAELLAEARALIAGEGFLHWQAAFPGVWAQWSSGALKGGFDAVIGNPPWDRMKLQQVEWFAARRREIAMAPRAADRRRMIAALEKAGDPLAADFARANARAGAALRMARTGGDYPLLSGGDANLYALFVERAMTLAKPDGMVGLLVPSGIAADKTAARFFKGVATEGRLKALYDFENRRTRHKAPPFFPDVDSRFKFCVFVASPQPSEGDAQCAFFLQDVGELADPDRRFALTPATFARVNPNTGTAPIFRSRRDAELTASVYERLPVMVDRSGAEPAKAWPVTYRRMFDMANDSGLFRTRAELEGKEGAWPIAGNRFDSPSGLWVPLYEGKMVQAFDHRAADVAVNSDNLFRGGQPENLQSSDKFDPLRQAAPRYWVRLDEGRWQWPDSWVVSFKDITAATNVRTMIAAILPKVGAGHTLPLLALTADAENRAATACLVAANLNATIFDYVARQKVPTVHFAWYLLEQLPVVPPERFEAVRFGPKTAGEIVRETALELAYTAHDMAPFARDMGHVNEAGETLPPFPWDGERRLRLRARLDAVFFHLYGVTDRDDAAYVFSTFPILERRERKAWGRYRSRNLCLAWISALAASQPDAEIEG